MLIVFLLVMGLHVALVLSFRPHLVRLFDELGIRVPAITEAMMGTAIHVGWILLVLALLVPAIVMRQRPRLRGILGSLGIFGGGIYLAALWLAFTLPLVEIANSLDHQLEGSAAPGDAPDDAGAIDPGE